MIPARKSRLFSRWFAGDADRRIRRSFDAVRVRGLETLRATQQARSVVIVTNHTAWWDPLVALVLTHRVLGADAYAMMDSRNLERLPFFGKVGAFGVDLTSASDGARAIRYAAKLLREERRIVWIFAQGREVPITARPLDFRPGSGEIARLANADVVCGALRYELGRTPRPTLWISFSDPIAPIRDARRARAAHETGVTRELDAIDRAIVAGASDAFVTLWEATPAPLFALAERVLAWLTRPRALDASGRARAERERDER